MFLFRTRHKMVRLERRLAKLEAQNAQLIQAVSHNHQQAGPSVAELVGQLANGQVQQIEATGGFIKLIHEIAVDRMGAAMGRRSAGQRGGKARAARAIRDERGRMRGSRERSGCILCDDPMTANFTTKQWEEHQAHRGIYERNQYPSEQRRQAQYDEPIETESHESHTHADGTVHAGPDHPAYPLPAVSIGHDHGGPGSDNSGNETAPGGAVVQ